jgi:hypothetical protein
VIKKVAALGHDPAAEQGVKAPAVSRGRAVPTIFSQNPELMALAAGIAVVGGTLGGLAGAGVFGGNANEGSPFKKK